MRLALLVLLLSLQALANMPDDVIAQVEAQIPKLQTLGETLNPGQRKLLLDRYVDLVRASPFTLGMNIDAKELSEYVRSRIPFNEAPGEADLKRSKRLVVQTETAAQYLDTLVKAFSGSVKGRKMDLNFVCSGKSFELPFVIDDSKDVLVLSMPGVPMPHPNDPSPEEDCLELRIHYKVSIMHIRALNSKHAACALPPKKAGTCLLQVAEKIARSLDKRRISLLDGSRVQCPKDRKEVDLRRLKTYKDGQGWYEGHGYLPIRDAEEFLVRRRAFFEYPLAHLQKGLELSKEYFHGIPALDLLEKKIRAFAVQEPTTDATAAQFMRWLWENDCPAYGVIDDYLSRTSNGLAFSKLYPADNSFVKILH